MSRLSMETSEGIVWLTRIEGRSVAEIVDELLKDRLSARLAKAGPEIERLKKLEAEKSELQQKAKAKLRAK